MTSDARKTVRDCELGAMIGATLLVGAGWKFTEVTLVRSLAALEMYPPIYRFLTGPVERELELVPGAVFGIDEQGCVRVPASGVSYFGAVKHPF